MGTKIALPSPMRRAPVALSLLFVLSCDTPEPHATPLFASAVKGVVGGTVNNGDPAVAFVAILSAEGAIASVCSGTLIDAFATSNDPESAMAAKNAGGVTPPKFVLTARHCIRRTSAQGDLPAGHVYPVEQVRVSFSTEPGVADLQYRVASHAFHTLSDIAMLELVEEAPATPIPLNGRPLEDYVGETIRVAGYGITNTGAGDAGTKRQGQARVLAATSNGVIRDSTRANLDKNDDIAILAQGVDGQTICSGDSGGPELLQINGLEYVAAVTSFSYGPPKEGVEGSIPDCGHPDTVAGVVRVDKNIDWIRSFIRERASIDFIEDNGPQSGIPGSITGGCGGHGLGGLGVGFSLLVAAALFRRRLS